MKKVFRPIFILLVAAMLLSVIGGCTTAGKGSESTTGSSTASSTTESEADKGPSWTWDTSPWEIENWYVGVPQFATKVYDPVNTMVDKVIFEKTGLKKVEFTFPATAQQEKLSTMIASNSLPDVITFPYSGNTQFMKLLEEGGVCEPLLELMDKYAPTFTPEIKKAQQVIDWWKSDHDGKWYAFINRSDFGRKERELPRISSLRMFARREFMEQLGIQPDDFNTQDGMVAALKKFKESGITQNGQPVYPVLMHQQTKPYDGYEYLAQYFGLTSEDKDGNYIAPIRDPKFVEFVKFMNRLFREGLFTDMNIVMKVSEARELVSNGRFFLWFGHDSVTNQIRDLGNQTNDPKYVVGVGPVRSNDGSDPLFATQSASSGYTVTYITKSAKNKDRIIRLAEFLYSKEGQILQSFGIEGVTYRVRPDGLLESLPEYTQELAKDRAAAEKKYGVGTFWFFDDSSYMNSMNAQKLLPYEELTVGNQIYHSIDQKFSSMVYINDCRNHSLVLDPKPGTPEADLNSQVNLYLDQQVTKMITASSEEEFDKIYNESLKKAVELGLDTVYEVQNKNFLAAKKKLGIQYAYPGNAK